MPPLRLAICLLTLLPTTTFARTWNVFADGTGDAPTIQAAMDSAAAGDTTLVWSGTYFESVSIQPGVSLIGQSGASSTIIDANGADLGVAGSSPLIEGITVTGVRLQSCGFGYGWLCTGTAMNIGGPSEIRDCIIEGNTGPLAGLGITGEVSVVNTRFARNEGGTDVPGHSGIVLVDGSLTVENCVFEELWYGDLLHVHAGQVVFRNNTLRNNDATDGIFVGKDASRVIIEDNLFDRHSAPITVSYDGSPRVEIRRNTFVRAGHQNTALGPFLGTNTLVEQNVFTGAGDGLWVWEGRPGVEIRCNDSWGNDNNWLGLPDLAGIDGNISEPPFYCNPTANDFAVAQNSPLLPANNSCGVLIGAFGQGCGPVAIEEVTWGQIKSRYRER